MEFDGLIISYLNKFFCPRYISRCSRIRVRVRRAGEGQHPGKRSSTRGSVPPMSGLVSSVRL